MADVRRGRIRSASNRTSNIVTRESGRPHICFIHPPSSILLTPHCGWPRIERKQSFCVPRGLCPWGASVEIHMLGKIGLPEVLILLAIALLIFGPSKLADLGKGLGEGIRNFKSAVSDGGKGDADKKS